MNRPSEKFPMYPVTDRTEVRGKSGPESVMGGSGVRLFRSKPRLGIVLLGSWLIATGILHLVPRISFSGSGEILAVLAIAAGVLLLLDR